MEYKGKDIIPSDSRYVPFVQQKSCCVPACISMIMYKRNIPLIPQELMGFYLGLTVAKENKNLFWNARTGKRPPTGYGSQIYKKQYEINEALTRFKIPLKMIYHPVSKFKTEKDFIDFLKNCLKEDRDILVSFNRGILDKGKDGEIYGHTCLIDRIYPSKNLIRLIDPSANSPKWKLIKIDVLKEAMEKHYIKSRGFREFVKK